jgi:hypothetical protein
MGPVNVPAALPKVIKDEPGRISPKAWPNRNRRAVPASVITEDFAPAAEGFVAGDDEGARPFEIDWIWRGIRGDIDPLDGPGG